MRDMRVRIKEIAHEGAASKNERYDVSQGTGRQRGGDLCHKRRVRVGSCAAQTVHTGSVTNGTSAHALPGRQGIGCVQRRDLQFPGAESGSGAISVPLLLRHGGHHRGVSKVGDPMCRQTARHVCGRAVRCGQRRSMADPGPDREETALLLVRGRESGLCLRTQTDHGVPGISQADQPGYPRQVSLPAVCESAGEHF